VTRVASAPAPNDRPDRPASDPGAPCLVFVHGGYWQRNRREDFCCFVQGALETGWSAALPGYTLGPEATLTEYQVLLSATHEELPDAGIF